MLFRWNPQLPSVSPKNEPELNFEGLVTPREILFFVQHFCGIILQLVRKFGKFQSDMDLKS